MLTQQTIKTDFCVVGGGVAGMCGAISAAREGLRVVLMQERPVLGGNASSEIRMWISGAKGRDNRETGILEEIELENLYRNPTKSFAIWDSILYSFVRREKNITLLLNCTCMDAEAEEGDFPYGRDRRIISVTGYQMTTQKKIRVEADFFADCSGDSILAPLSGAQCRIGREAAQEFGELSQVKTADAKTMGMSCLIQGRETNQKISYNPPEWSFRLSGADFKNRLPNLRAAEENFWYLELGGNRDSIADTEEIRDELLSLATGTWDYIKNSGNFDSAGWDLDFLGFLPGKRESRRLLGEILVTQKDISDGRVYEDEVAYGGWPLDDHYPEGFYHQGVPNTDYHTPAPYSLPYRALYSKNVCNLFFAGRNISVTHTGLSSTRVMGTCGLLGEAIGRAAFLANKYRCSPHEVYLTHLDELQQLLMNGDCFLPSRKRNISRACSQASLTGASDRIRNGQDRAHAIYAATRKTNDGKASVTEPPVNEDAVTEAQGTETSLSKALGTESAGDVLLPGQEVIYTFPKQRISRIHIVFDSDLNRDTLTGAYAERCRSTRANLRLDSPQQKMPSTLCRAFELSGIQGGARLPILAVSDNHKRCYDVPVRQDLEGLRLQLFSAWGQESIPLISFDFR